MPWNSTSSLTSKQFRCGHCVNQVATGVGGNGVESCNPTSLGPQRACWLVAQGSNQKGRGSLLDSSHTDAWPGLRRRFVLAVRLSQSVSLPGRSNPSLIDRGIHVGIIFIPS